MAKQPKTFRFHQFDIDNWNREARKHKLTLTAWIERKLNNSVKNGK